MEMPLESGENFIHYLHHEKRRSTIHGVIFSYDLCRALDPLGNKHEE